MSETSNSKNVSTKLQQIAKLSSEAPDMVLTTLAHHIDVEFLREAYRRVRKDGATGVDRQTAGEYAQNLEENLETLLNGFKSGSYKAPPVRRTYIPKGNGTERPLGIPTFEDKVLQKAVTMVLEAVYEEEFLDCSYGYRPNRSAHDALQSLWENSMKTSGGWIIEVDIENYFENLEHGHMRSFLDTRVRDGILRRMIDKWLKAGVMEDGCVRQSKSGSPQGGVISPLLSNIYLHKVLDIWFEEMVKPCLSGTAHVYRFADDCLIVCSNKRDADKILAVLSKRFGKYGLTLHPRKTQLVDFRCPSLKEKSWVDNQRYPTCFDFLGFTHYWGKSRKGSRLIKRKTAPDRFRRALKETVAWCQKHRHLKVREQYGKLSAKLQGHYAYYGITGNIHALQRFRTQVEKAWFKWLNRRSQKRSMNWKEFIHFRIRYLLPTARVVQSVYR